MYHRHISYAQACAMGALVGIGHSRWWAYEAALVSRPEVIVAHQDRLGWKLGPRRRRWDVDDSVGSSWQEGKEHAG